MSLYVVMVRLQLPVLLDSKPSANAVLVVGGGVVGVGVGFGVGVAVG